MFKKRIWLVGSLFILGLVGVWKYATHIYVLQANPIGYEIRAEVKVGGGIISPYKIVEAHGVNDALIVLTGGGESSGTAYLHMIRASDFTPMRTPLRVGSNGSAMQYVGELLVVACRSSRELVLVDPKHWVITDRQQLPFLPISISTVDENDLLVSGYMSPILARYRISKAQKLELARNIQLDEGTYESFFYHGKAYVSHPTNGTIAEIDIGSGTVTRRIKTGGTPSYGMAFWEGRLWVTNREGYLNEIDLSKGTSKAHDLAVLLGLDRKKLAARGIEPTDIIPSLQGLYVVNNRQDSLLLVRQGGKLVAKASIAGGAYGEYYQGRLYITVPSSNKIRVVQIMGEAPVVENRMVGVNIVQAENWDGQRIVILDSNLGLTLVDRNGIRQQIAAPEKLSWLGPISTGKYRLVVAHRTDVDQDVIAELNEEGEVLRLHPLQINRPVFSIRQSGNRAILVSRLKGVAQEIDIASGQHGTWAFQHPRPRHMQPFGKKGGMAIHDTAPGIGLSIGAAQKFVAGQQLGLKSWLSDIRLLDSDEMALLTFSGEVALVKESGELVASRKLPLSGAMTLRYDGKNNLYAISESDQIALRFDSRLKNDKSYRIRYSGLNDLLPASNNEVWLIGQTGVALATLDY